MSLDPVEVIENEIGYLDKVIAEVDARIEHHEAEAESQRTKRERLVIIRTTLQDAQPLVPPMAEPPAEG